MDTSEEANVALSGALRFYHDNNDSVIFSFYKPVKSVLQDGPCCGLVALAMAAQMLVTNTITVNAILAKAKDMHFTNSGEMFSAQNMTELAQNLFPCQATLIRNLSCNSTLLVNHVLSGSPLLIPYDADKNHVPCCKRGHHAHWAIVSGVCLVIPLNVLGDNYHESEIYHTKDGDFLKSLSHSARKILVYAHHGKSKRIAVWELDELLSSNANLFEIHEKHDLTTMILPEGDLLGGLRDQAVLLKAI